MKTLRVSLLILIALSFMLTPGGDVKAEPRMKYRYVVPEGSTTSAYCTAYEPCDLRYAIDQIAEPGDIIVVHSGTYYSMLPSIDLIFIDKDLTLWGSCEFDAATPFICYPDAHSSILDGEGFKRVIRVEGSGIEEVHIEGFTITRGNGISMVPCYGGVNGCGAGIHATNLEKLSLENNYIWANKAGNTSGFGGGLFAENINYFDAQDNTFIFNQATETGLGAGGGAFITGSGGPHAVVFKHNIFSGNETSVEDNPNSASAGLLVTYSNNVQILKNIFEYQNAIHQNTALRGTSIYLSFITGFIIKENSFEHDWGSAVVHVGTDSDGYISKNKWWNNMVFYNLVLIGNVQADIFNNFLGRQMLTTASRGGSSTNIYMQSDNFSGYNDVSIFFNTLAAANYGINVGQYSSVDIAANIFTGLTDPITLYSTDVTANIDRNLFYSNTSNSNPGDHPIYANPMLADMANGDFHLTPGSGAINQVFATDFDEDIDGDFRPIGSGPTPYDVGADEFQYKIYLPLILR